MGLDMYLTKRIYIDAEYNHRNISGSIQITQDGKEIPIKFDRIKYIEESVGYWRKANHIHKWFVDNVQSGKDDCEQYDVSKAQCEKLLELCKKIKNKESRPEEVLPRESGFFFGGTDYDEYYERDIDSTIEIMETILFECDASKDYFGFDLYYQSSW